MAGEDHAGRVFDGFLRGFDDIQFGAKLFREMAKKYDDIQERTRDVKGALASATFKLYTLEQDLEKRKGDLEVGKRKVLDVTDQLKATRSVGDTLRRECALALETENGLREYLDSRRSEIEILRADSVREGADAERMKEELRAVRATAEKTRMDAERVRKSHESLKKKISGMLGAEKADTEKAVVTSRLLEEVRKRQEEIARELEDARSELREQTDSLEITRGELCEKTRLLQAVESRDLAEFEVRVRESRSKVSHARAHMEFLVNAIYWAWMEELDANALRVRAMNEAGKATRTYLTSMSGRCVMPVVRQ